MDVATIVNIILCVLSFVLAAISVVTVIITLKQNSRMIEESTRPVLSFYTASINTGGGPAFYFVARNFGGSIAVIESISSKQDFANFIFGAELLDEVERFEPIRNLQNAVIAPGQSRICALDYNLTPNRIEIDVEYRSNVGKKYKEHISFDPKAGVDMLTTKSSGRKDDTGSTLEKMSYTLQEMLQKEL